jgi:hypothetical protein
MPSSSWRAQTKPPERLPSRPTPPCSQRVCRCAPICYTFVSAGRHGPAVYSDRERAFADLGPEG